MAQFNNLLTSNFVQNIEQITGANATQGNIVSFFYNFYKHDPYPVILTTGITRDGRMTGLNLHYLPFPIYRDLLNTWGDNPMFNYQIIKNNAIIKQAFRSYKIYGIKRAKKINWKAILSAMSIIRNYSPQEIQNIQDTINQQVMSRQPEILNELFGNMIANVALQQAAAIQSQSIPSAQQPATVQPQATTQPTMTPGQQSVAPATEVPE